MIESSGDECTLYVAPRRYFALDDGLYIPGDVRHRAARFGVDASVPGAAGMYTMLMESLCGGLRPVNPNGSIFADLENALRGTDAKYDRWLNSLLSFLDEYEYALPRRSRLDYLVPGSEALRIEFRETAVSQALAPATQFPAPPGGVILSDRSALSIDPEVQVAQSRGTDAPSLIWKTGDGFDGERAWYGIYKDEDRP